MVDVCDDQLLVTTGKAHGGPELPDAYLPVRTVLERLTVVQWVAPRRGDDSIEFVEYPVLLSGR